MPSYSLWPLKGTCSWPLEADLAARLANRKVMKPSSSNGFADDNEAKTATTTAKSKKSVFMAKRSKTN